MSAIDRIGEIEKWTQGGGIRADDYKFLLRAFKVMREIAVNLQARELTRGTNFRPADVLDGAERWVDPEFEAAMQKPLDDRPG